MEAADWLQRSFNPGLVDEYLLWIHPVILGKGNPFSKIMNRII